MSDLLQTARSHHQAGRLPEAERLYRQVLNASPGDTVALRLLGMVCRQTGRVPEAAALLARAAAREPKDFDLQLLAGLDHLQINQAGLALPFLRAAAQLKANEPRSLAGLGRALLAVGQPEAGLSALKSAIALKPDFPDALAAAGPLLARGGQPAEALAALRRAVGLNPRHASAQFNLALLLQEQRQIEAALPHARQAVALRPDFAEGHNLLASLLGITGDVTAAIAGQRRAVALSPANAGFHSNLLLSLHYLDQADGGLSPEAVFAEHLEWAKQHTPSPGTPGERRVRVIRNCGEHRAPNIEHRTSKEMRVALTPNPLPEYRDRGPEARRVRVGYISADFNEHPIAAFIEPIFANHDRAAFEVFAYADISKPDTATARLRAHVEHWRDIHAMNDGQVAEQIRRDGVDVLIDLAGHTARNRLLVFAQKPAPVQVTYLGYPDTTGMTAMTHRLTDSIADPPGMSEHRHTEKLIRLDPCAWVYWPPADAPAVAPLPAVANGFVTFGSFNNLPKISPATVRLWAEVLRAVPGSRLVLKAVGLASDLARRRLVEQFAAAGVAENRLQLRGPVSSTAQHLGAYAGVDLALDPHPYHGTTTTCEAMWMGVPVVTLAGRTHASRVGASLLSAVGLSELVATTPPEYVAIVLREARDVEHLATRRAGLRERMRASPLLDGVNFTKRLEAAFAEALATCR